MRCFPPGVIASGYVHRSILVGSVVVEVWGLSRCPALCYKTPLYLPWQRGVLVLDGQWGSVVVVVWGCRHKAVGVWCEHIGSEKDVQAKTGGVVGLECDFFCEVVCLQTGGIFSVLNPLFFLISGVKIRVGRVSGGASSEVCCRLLWLLRRLCACYMSSSIHTSAFSLFSLVKNNTTCQITCY